MNQLMKASDLALPRISGTVSVNLEELDRLRAEHATAVKLAQELESKQALVKIVVGENRSVRTTYREFSGYDSYTDVFEQKSVEYKGFDEFRETIRIEEYSKIEKDIKTLRDDLDDKKKSLSRMEETWKKTQTGYEEVIKERDLIEKERDKLLAELEDRDTTIKNLIETNQSLFSKENETFMKLRDLEKRKITFWFWLKTALDNIRNFR